MSKRKDPLLAPSRGIGGSPQESASDLVGTNFIGQYHEREPIQAPLQPEEAPKHQTEGK